MNMPSLLLLLGECFVKGALVLLAAGLVVRMWRGASAAQRHFVWLAAIVVLLLLPATRLVTPRWKVAVEKAQRIRIAAPVVTTAPAADRLPLAQAQIATARVSRAWRLPDWRSVVGAVWLAGALGLVASRLVGSWRLRSLRERALPITDKFMLNTARQISREFGIGRAVTVLVSEECRVPVTWGIWRPVLLLPAAVNVWSEARVTAALRHEAGHINRHDYLVRWIAHLACAFYWPNPLVWLAARALRIAQEQATDDLVLRGGVPPDEYATQLVETARTVVVQGLFTQDAVAMASSSTLEDRVLAIVDEQRDRRPLDRWATVVGLLVMAIALAVCTAAQVQGADKAPAAMEQSGVAESKAPLQVLIEARFVELPQDDKADRELLRAPLSVFANAQFQDVVRGLNQREGVDLLSAPRVVTRSKNRAIIEIIREFRYPTAWEKDAGIWKPTEFEAKNVGVTLDVVPEIKADGTIDLQLKPSVVEFLGFVDLETGKSVAAARASNVAEFTFPDTKPLEPLGRLKSVFSERKTETNVVLKPGSTVVLSQVRETAAVKPFEKNAPTRPLIVFVTASVIDPAQQKEAEKPKAGSAAAERAAAIVLPTVEFRDVTVQEAVLSLMNQAREVDPEGRGVDIVLKPVPNPKAKLSVSFTRIPLSEALRYVASLGGLEVTAEPEKLVLGVPENAAAAPEPPRISVFPPSESTVPADKAAAPLLALQLPQAMVVPRKPGFVVSPYAPKEAYVDVRGFKPGTEVKCPYTGKLFLVPPEPAGDANPSKLTPRSEVIRPADAESRIEGRAGIELRSANPTVPRRRPGEF
jgi:beta-lactamase regulating signal transducer with metallopeptidase domain